MTNFPDGFFKPRRVDGVAVRASLTKAGGLEILAWDGAAWTAAEGVDFAEFGMAIPASASFLDKIGVPAGDPSRAPSSSPAS